MRSRILVAAALALAGLPLLVAPAGGGRPSSRQIVITKVVEGAGPTGGYEMQLECIEEDVRAAGSAQSLTFDAAGPGNPESQTVALTDVEQTCTLTETDANGAEAVLYQCADSPPGALCQNDRSVRITTIQDSSAAAITVTNRFDPDVLSADGRPDSGNDPGVGSGGVDSGVVAASPAFTG